MEHIVNLHIEHLPDGVYLATSDDIPGLVAPGPHRHRDPGNRPRRGQEAAGGPGRTPEVTEAQASWRFIRLSLTPPFPLIPAICRKARLEPFSNKQASSRRCS